MSEQYWVVGGEYTDTSFTDIVGGKPEERHGPYVTADKARDAWAGLSMLAVDDAHTRYRIEREGGEEYWVTGGTYTDTDFSTRAPGTKEDRLGPFTSYEQALDTWRGKAWATVDDGFVRYRIEQI